MSVIQLDFDKYYGALFGERWPSLREALLIPENQVRHYNSFLTTKALGEKIPWLESCTWNLSTEAIPRAEEDLLQYYVLDPASVLVAENLRVRPGDKVLDLCAAPGGKSLVLAKNLFREAHEKSELVLNELSADRRERLKKVVQQYIPRKFREQVWVRGKDGTRFGLEVQDHFDAILLDAPCSGERHLMANQTELQQWKEKRTKGLAQKQYTLLCSAWLALKPGGRLVYSTCALSSLENDGVIEKFLKKKDGVEVGQLERLGPNSEATKFGVIYLPDRCQFGPMYSCLLIKTASA